MKVLLLPLGISLPTGGCGTNTQFYHLQDAVVGSLLLLISILACSLGFHAITLERSTSKKIVIFLNQASVEMNLLVSLFCCLVAENVVTDRQTDGQNDKPSTVTLAAHARQGLISGLIQTLSKAQDSNTDL